MHTNVPRFAAAVFSVTVFVSLTKSSDCPVRVGTDSAPLSGSCSLTRMDLAQYSPGLFLVTSLALFASPRRSREETLRYQVVAVLENNVGTMEITLE